ncbi:hypothetical protein D3OALGA1CA_2082 [Olavius algarvensis associated proteobacterium Delta 3]|nr:hypothetical protein D3OALGA1CA_2082 [Olavius algarvensis associated proteobacterium Delta 3]CAB5120860.1 hypothetical protein D3OALGB2SA_2976 [Olavius algarvensis associated proteobacterium Delta 3]
MTHDTTLAGKSLSGLDLILEPEALEFVRHKKGAATIWLYSRPFGAG